MTDFHVHMGQWFDIYYNSEAVFSALKATGTDEIWFSSTSSERYCTESPAVLCGKVSSKGLPSARDLYEELKNEVSEALDNAKVLNLKAHPLFWVVPELHKSKDVNISLEEAMSSLPYEGFKLHPRGNEWDLEDKGTLQLTEDVFSYAEKHNLLILIHCGPDPFELPTKFESFIAKHPDVTVQLAHTRPLEETLYMLKKYPNTICDTAFAPKDVIDSVKEAGFAERIRFGTDFPITHYYYYEPNEDPTSEQLTEFLRRKWH